MLNLLFLPGLGSSADAFISIKSTGLLQNINIIGHNYAGHNPRPHDAYPDQPLQHATDEGIEIISNTPGQFILAGHSMGNAIAMLMTQMLPEKIIGLVSLEGNLMSENCTLVSRNMVNAKNNAELENIKNDLIERFKDSPRPGWRNWAQDLITMPIQVMRDYARELVKLSDSGELLTTFQNFNGPKCYLYGDSYVGSVMVEKLAGIPAYHVPAAGHFLLQDQPEICARHIRQICDTAQ